MEMKVQIFRHGSARTKKGNQQFSKNGSAGDLEITGQNSFPDTFSQVIRGSFTDVNNSREGGEVRK